MSAATTGPAPFVGTTPVKGLGLLDRTSTGEDLVQWIDHSGQWTATPGRTLLLENLCDARPIRTGAQYPNRPNRHGWYAFTGRCEHVWFESALEMEALLSLDQRGVVAEIAPQPLNILFRRESPCTSHVPDFIANLTTGEQVLIDVKPASRMTPKVLEQFEETARVCRDVGWGHWVLSEEHPNRRRNLAALREFRHARCHPQGDSAEQVLSLFQDSRSLAEGRMLLNPSRPALAMPLIGHLICHRFLDMPWDQPLDLDTVLTTTTKGTSCCNHA